MKIESSDYKIAQPNGRPGPFSFAVHALLLLTIGSLLVLPSRAELACSQPTNAFSCGFETQYDLDNWYTDYGYWEMGVPTSGPQTNSAGRRAFAGMNCAATVLDGDYTEDRSSRLISPPISIPPANQNPRLRFWHWWSFGANDWSQVLISTNNGTTWNPLSPAYSATSNELWTRPLLDLKAYAGRTVRIAFYFESHNSGWPNYTVSVGPGWYIDEVVVETGPSAAWVAGSVEDFENTCSSNAWVADFGIWEIGTPASGPSTNAFGKRSHSASNCLATVLSGNHPEDRSSRVMSPAFSVPDEGQNPRLRFWHWWSFGNSDFGQVQITTNNGASWEALTAYSTYSASSSDLWTRPLLDLTRFAGMTVRVGFYFESHNSGWPNYTVSVGPGWYIDELLVETGPQVVRNPEGFELGWGSWAADFGIWEVGAPASGPPTNSAGLRAYLGTNCAATVLAGNYPEDRSSRLSSPSFIVPPAACNPNIRFRSWWSFGANDWGQFQISTNDGASWIGVGPTLSASGGNWTQTPPYDLRRFAGMKVRLGFYVESHNSGWPNYTVSVGPGWYIDEIRLIHDPALVMLDSPVVRTQSAACVSLGLAMSSPSSAVSFQLQSLPGYLNNFSLGTIGCWSGNVVASNDQSLVTLQNSCPSATMGVQPIGSVCFATAAGDSAFVPLIVNGCSVLNYDGSEPRSYASGSRVTVIGNSSLLESSIVSNQRKLTLYGKPNTTYEVRYATDLNASHPWPAAWTNTVPEGLSSTWSLQGAFSNAPLIFFHAIEK